MRTKNSPRPASAFAEAFAENSSIAGDGYREPTREVPLLFREKNEEGFSDIIRVDEQHFRDGLILAAWDVWISCSIDERPLPKSVAEYIDKIAAGFLELVETPPRSIKLDLQTVICVKSSVGKGSQFSRYKKAKSTIDSRADNIETYSKLFEDGFVLAAWDVWLACRASDRRIPEAVEEYINAVAVAFLELTDAPPKRMDPNFQIILGIKSARGRGSPFSQYREAVRSMDQAAEVASLRTDVDGRAKRTLEKSVQEVADNSQISPASGPDTVRRAYAKHQRRRKD